MTERDFYPKDSIEQIHALQEQVATECDEYIAETREHTYRGKEDKEVTFLNNGRVVEISRGIVTSWNVEFEVEREDRSLLLFGRRVKPKTTYILRERVSAMYGMGEPSGIDEFRFTVGSCDPEDTQAYEDSRGRLQKWLEIHREREAE
ncbi:MAG: hypothetical protein WD467_02250 [Candidatus Saccharimonadales bacterium]